MISVKVCYRETGLPAAGAKVCLGFKGFFGGMSREQYSDGNGEAHFENDPALGTVYVNGKDVHSGNLSGMTVVYI